MRSFVVLGQTASASPEFRLDDLPGSSGRLDVPLRCIRAALLVSHGLRPGVRLYLVLCGGAGAPRVLRIDSDSAKFLRPDERSLALLVQKTLASAPSSPVDSFVELRPGIALAPGGLERVLSDLSGALLFVLEEGATDVRALPLPSGDAAFFLGDHRGYAPADRRLLTERGAVSLSIGPTSVHSEDAITILWNELDRRVADGAVFDQ